MEANDPFETDRLQMVAKQIERRGLMNERLLDALRRIPRHQFVPPEQRSHAYEDRPLPIGSGQTISQPYIVALMTSLLGLQGSENVLEIGAGSGYQAAVLGFMATSVHTVERHEPLVEQATQALAALGIQNVHIHTGDGSLGWSDAAPYDAIMVTAAAPRAPQPLLDQLADGGRLVIPVGSSGIQELQLWTRNGDTCQHESLIQVSFVPLRGAHGWDPSEWR